MDDIVTIQALDKANKVLDTKSVMVKAANVTTIGSVTPGIFTIGDKNLIGTYTHDVKSIILTVNGVNYKGGTFHSEI
ncbi:immunoglobulin-like domain-containing protein [Listeria grandensis]|uniref:immunoglobulin-like domain-containing protein n=1 Tax=Listeria grandensis TaxID=1494963 RepID=UPI0028935301|nr:immunoglobulin-like domain-containing protein [Listeria grandensis]